MNREQWPEWLQVLGTRLPNERPEAHVARIMTEMAGCSLKKNRIKLEEFFFATEPTRARAQAAAQAATNCGTSTICAWVVAGCDVPMITQPFAIATSITRIIEAAKQQDAIIYLKDFPDIWRDKVEPGWLLHYNIPGTNYDHVETCLSVPDFETGMAMHVGGGRADNLISIEGPDDIRWNRKMNAPRPLLAVIRPDRMIWP